MHHPLTVMVAVAIVMALLPARPSDATPVEPFDYVELADDVTRAAYPAVVTEDLRITMDDGIEIFVRLTRPDPDAYPDLRAPVILSPSPYHGSLGDRSGSGLIDGPASDDEDDPHVGLPDYFSTRGYAVGMVDLRGTGRSGGCLNHLGARDADDLGALIEWAATRSWANGKVGMIGHSYPGFATAAGVAQHHEALATGVIIAGGASMYDHQFQRGVPYFLQYAGPQAGYPALTSARYVPYLGDSEEYATAGCGFNDSALLAGSGQVTGQYEAWHAERDFRQAVVDAQTPLLINHGVADEQIRTPAMEWYFTERLARTGDKVWVGPWGHEAGNGGRPGQWRYLLHAWFDRHLLGRDIHTGPPVEAFFGSGEAVVANTWTAAEETLTLYPDASDMSLRLDPPSQEADVAFTATGNADGALQAVDPIGLTPSSLDDGGIEFVLPALADDLVLLGVPRLRLQASVTAEVVHLVTILYRERAGQRELLGTCAIQPQLREGIKTLTPVVPGEVMDLPLQCFLAAHQLRAGDGLVLRVGTGSHHHFTPFSADGRITVHTGPDATTYELPHRPDALVQPAPAAEPRG